MDNNKLDLVIPRLYISSLRVANNESALRKKGITHILSVCPMRPTHFGGITYKLVSISDSPDHRIDLRFQECFAFIQDALSIGGTVLVHCFQGVSRSASIILGYLITYNDLNFAQAFRFLKERRSQINPNYGFLHQLRNYATRLGRRD